MIAFKNKRPLLQTGHCVISDYDLNWLEGVLQEAADRAGTRLPFRREIAEGVLLYLENACPLHAVPLDYLFSRLRSTLLSMGLPRIAGNLRTQTPPVDIDLDGLAGESPLPLFFYSALSHRVKSLRELGLTSYHFSGREKCSLTLGDRRRACPAQARALQELDAFLQAVTSA